MRLARFAAVLAAVYALVPVARAEQKMAFVDLQRALVEVEEGKAAKAKLKGEFDKRQKSLDAEQEQLKADKDDLDKRSMAMTPDAKAAKEQELMQKVQEVQKHYMTMQGELQDQERAATQGIFQKMEGIIGEIAQSEGLTFVFDKNGGLVYAPPSLDLTNELIRRYNDKYPASGGKAGTGKSSGSKKSSK